MGLYSNKVALQCSGPSHLQRAPGQCSASLGLLDLALPCAQATFLLQDALGKLRPVHLIGQGEDEELAPFADTWASITR